MKSIDISKVNTFLYWGYLPLCNDADYFGLSPVSIKNPDIQFAAKMLSEEIAKHNPEGKDHVIPMSGGLDSRLILCELLQFVHADKIRLFTFGIPGSYDYEIPELIAKKLGIKIERVNLHEVNLNTDDIISSLTPSNLWTYLLDSFYNRLAFKRFGKEVYYWSGFMGNNLAGEHLGWYSGESWDEARKIYVSHERLCKGVQLYSEGYDPFDSIMKTPDDTIIPYIDQLDFRHRQPKCILSILNAPSTEYNQFFPLTSKSFMNYMMGLPFNERKGEVFYRRLVQERTDCLRDIPVKRTYCLPLRYEGTLRSKFKRAYINGVRILSGKPSPMLNYYDFNTAFRERADIRRLIESNLADLSKRNILPWLDIIKIQKKFFEEKVPIHDAISTLVSLEIYLKYENI